MNVFSRTYPEVGAGGFTRIDGTVQFYVRVNALVRPSFRVLDLGAGRGAWLEGANFQRHLRLLKGRVSEVIGHDMDPAVLTNPSLDRAVVSEPDQPLPINSSSIDLIIADYVLEHVSNPVYFAREVRRVLKPGGWFCARTPNKWGYVSIATRLVRNAQHTAVLARVQPGRKEIDVFPTQFRLNTFRAIRKHFGRDFRNFSYAYQPEPSYHFGSRYVVSALALANRMLPDPLKANLFIFLQRQGRSTSTT